MGGWGPHIYCDKKKEKSVEEPRRGSGPARQKGQTPATKFEG